MPTTSLGESVVDRRPDLPLAAASKVEALVLAGSHNWRDTAFDNLMPRPLLPVAQLPLIAYSLRWLRAFGATSATVCSNGFSNDIRDLVRPFRRWLPPLAFHDDAAPRGAAGSARDAALATDGDLFVVVDATTIPDVDLQRVIDEHRITGAALTIVVQPGMDDSSRQRGLVPTGIYVFSRRALEAVPATGYQDIKESLIPKLYATGELVTTTEAEGPCPRVMDANSYLSVSQRIISESTNRRDQVFGEHEMSPRLGVTIHPRARVSDAALIVGPVLIDAGAEVLAGATIVGPASVGPNCIVSSGALVSRSILWSGCVVLDGAVVDRAVLADDVRVNAGQRVVGMVKSSGKVRRREPAEALTPVPELAPATTGASFR